MAEDRIERVADVIASLGYGGIVKFDKTEPEYHFIASAYDRFDNPGAVALLSILAATQDYQLAGDAQRFWTTLGSVVRERDALHSEAEVKETLDVFIDEPVNARLRDQKRDRLDRLRENGFDTWFLAHHHDINPIQVWEELAAGLETTQDKKTVVLAMKIYDIFNLIVDGEYLELPTDVPIPCDLQVEHVAGASGIVEDEEKAPVIDAWARVMERVNSELDRPVSMLRIDSIVWQAGQIISENEDHRTESRRDLEEHFRKVGIGPEERQRLARELTTMLPA